MPPPERGRTKLNPRVTRERLVYKTGLSLVTIAASGLVRLVFSVLVGHLFGAPLLGHVNVIISAAVFGTLLCSPGLGQAVAREMAIRGLRPGDAAGRSLLRGATAAHHALCLAVAVLAGLLVPADGWQQHVLAMALTFGYGCYTYYKAVLYGVDLVRRYAALELGWDGLFLAALIAVAVTGSQPWVLAPMVLLYLGFSAGAHRSVLHPRRPAGEMAPGASTAVEAAAAPEPHGGFAVPWRALAAFAAVTAVGTASSAGFLQLSQLFAARAGSGHDSGLFAAAMTLVTPAYLLPRAISLVLFPAMARAAGRADTARVRSHLTIGTHALAAAMLPGFVLAGCLAATLLGGIYGSGFAGGGATFAVMAWATWVSIASVPAVNALSSDTGRGYLIPAGASVLGFCVGLVLWLAAGTSIMLVAWGYLAGSVLQSAIPVLVAARRHGGLTAWLGLRAVTVAAAGLAVALLVTSRPVPIQVVVGVAGAVLAALAVLPELRALMRARPSRSGAGRAG